MSSLTEMREGLHVSVSQIKCYLRCPRQYRFRYVLGAEPEFIPASLVLGSAVHEGLAAYYRSVMATGDSPEQDVCRAAFYGTLVGFRKNKLPIKDGEGIEAQGEALLKVFYETVYQDPPNVVGVEVPFTIELPDPTTGEILEEALVGALDLVVREEQKHVVGEHKTAAKKWSKDQIKNDGQLSAYKLVARKAGSGRGRAAPASADQDQEAKDDRGKHGPNRQGRTRVPGNRGGGAASRRRAGVLPNSQWHVRWVRIPAPVQQHLI
jgi:hypothetical protein